MTDILNVHVLLAALLLYCNLPVATRNSIVTSHIDDGMEPPHQLQRGNLEVYSPYEHAVRNACDPGVKKAVGKRAPKEPAALDYVAMYRVPGCFVRWSSDKRAVYPSRAKRRGRMHSKLHC